MVAEHRRATLSRCGFRRETVSGEHVYTMTTAPTKQTTHTQGYQYIDSTVVDCRYTLAKLRDEHDYVDRAQHEGPRSPASSHHSWFIHNACQVYKYGPSKQ